MIKRVWVPLIALFAMPFFSHAWDPLPEEIEGWFMEGVRYYKGEEGGKPDFGKAISYWNRAAEQGYAPAQFNLGVLYDTADTLQNPWEAFKYYKLAADKGYAPAQFNVGVAFEKGEGIPKDLGQAKHYYGLAKNQNYAPAIKRLRKAIEPPNK